jgi:hypothetical protein
MDAHMNRRTFCTHAIAIGAIASLGGGRAIAKGKNTQPSKMSLPTAINKAGRQRMLSQRIAKAYAQLGLAVLPDRAFKIMNESIELFDQQLTELAQFAPTPETTKTYAELSDAWKQYRSLVATAPAPEVGAQIQEINETVLKIAHRGTVELEKYAGTELGKLVNISGRQRMLSQRTAKFFMFREWSLPKPVESDLNAARNEFKAALITLRAAPETTPEIKGQLALAETQWLFFESAIEQSLKQRSDNVARQNVATTSERILEVFESVTAAYERQSG